MADYIRYTNQRAGRNLPLSDDLIKRLAYLQDLGVEAEVFSGGVGENAGALSRSGRHVHGGAGDMRFHKDGRQLDWANPDDLPIYQEIVKRGKQNGITGWGAGDGYMSAGTVHVGMGNPGVWGKNGKSENAAGWLKAAYNGTEYDPSNDAVAIAQKAQPQPSPVSDNPLMAAVQAKAPDPKPVDPAKPESRNGILVQAFNKLTGSDYQVPSTILGAKTGDVMKGIGGIGDFAKSMMESDEAINKQIQANARNSGRSNTPVELDFTPTAMLKRKRRGSLSGLGGYFV